MHVPDGFLDAPTSLATAAVAATAVGVALRKARDELDERTAPLAGLTAAFVFAVQMLNFPVGVGTSGHLMGERSPALVGPWTAVLCVSVVLMVQALLFADGGLTAARHERHPHRRRHGSRRLVRHLAMLATPTGFGGTGLRRGRAGLGAAGALVFVVLFAIGGRQLSLGMLTATMVGWHVLIGIGEAVITALTVSAVVAVRPDLVYAAAHGLRPGLKLKDADGILVDAPGGGGRRGDRAAGGMVIGGGLAALVLAGVVSFYASASPDGLEYVAGENGSSRPLATTCSATSPLPATAGSAAYRSAWRDCSVWC